MGDDDNEEVRQPQRALNLDSTPTHESPLIQLLFHNHHAHSSFSIIIAATYFDSPTRV
jgi:hypothetical protein